MKVAIPGTAVRTKIVIMNTRQGYEEPIGRFVTRLHALTNTSGPSTEYTKVDGTQDIVHIERLLAMQSIQCVRNATGSDISPPGATEIHYETSGKRSQ